MKATTRWRLFLAVASGWGLCVVVFYAKMAFTLPAAKASRLYETAGFFCWQGAGTLLVLLVVSLARPRLAGRACVAYLVLSSMALLAFSRDAELIAGFALFAVWCVLAISSVRLALERLGGEAQGTWGLAAGALYALLIPASFFFGLLGLMARGPVTVLALAAAVPGGLYLARNRRPATRAVVRWADGLGPVGAAALGAAWIGLAVAFVWACTPETASDSIRTHLPYMQQLARDGGLGLQHLDFQRLMIYGVRTLFTCGYVVASTAGAKWLSWFAAVALMMVVSEEVSRRSGQRALGVFAGAAVVTTPLVLSLARTLYHDHVITLLCMTAFVSLFRALERGDRRGVLLSAFLIGCAVQTKYSALLFGGAWSLTLVSALVWRNGLSAGLKRSLPPLLCLAVAASPWYAYTYYATGNPIFPFFNEHFKSPLWPPGLPTAFNYAQFSFGDDLSSRIRLPWSMTFESSKIDQLPDGRLGFLFLALLPFLLALVERRCRRGLDLGTAGLIGFLAIGMRTLYARYWLPMYPLVLMALFLALGGALERARWRPSRYLNPVVTLGAFSALLLTLPVLVVERFGLPWDVYSKATSEEAWMAARFDGLPAVRELNQSLEPSDKVLVSGYSPVHTVAAEAYALPYWTLRNHSVADLESFERFVADNDVRYWIVDHTSRDATFFDRQLSAGTRFWTDSRRIAAHAGVAAYSIAPAGRPLPLLESRVVKPLLLTGSSAGSRDPSGWKDLARARSRQLSDSGLIEIPPTGMVGFEFTVAAGAETSGVLIDRILGPQPGTAIMSFLWWDEDRKVVGRLSGGVAFDRHRGETRFFDTVPAGAKGGRFSIRPWKSRVRLAGARIEFWSRDENEP